MRSASWVRQQPRAIRARSRPTTGARPTPRPRDRRGRRRGGSDAVSITSSAAGARLDEDSQLEVRPLSYTDLPAVLGIERRVFPTPWSLAMFVLELSKQTGICLAAVQRGAEARTPP